MSTQYSAVGAGGGGGWFQMALGRLRRLAAGGGARNFAWLGFDQVFRLSVGVVMGAWTARWLGAANFGTLSYAMAAIFVVASLGGLGMEGLVVQRLIEEPTRRGPWLGTVLGFRLGASLLLALITCGVVAAIRPDDSLRLRLVAILAVGFVAQSLEAGQLDFQARSAMGRLVVPRLIVFLGVATLRFALLACRARVEWFAVITSLEQVACGVLTWWMLRRELGGSDRLSWSWQEGCRLLTRSWPLAMSGFAVSVYMKAGQLLVGHLLDDTSLGVFSAGMRIPEMLGFVPMILATSALPGLARWHKAGDAAYRGALMRYFRINFLLAMVACTLLSAFSGFLVRGLFGPGYGEAGPILAVYAWTLLFVAAGIARSQHMLLTNQTHLSLSLTVFGLAVNFGANLVLIPRMGAMGAAIATVVSYAIQAYFSSFLFPSIRDIGRKQAVAMVTPWLAFRG